MNKANLPINMGKILALSDKGSYAKSIGCNLVIKIKKQPYSLIFNSLKRAFTN